MSGMDEVREKMPKGSGRSPRHSRFPETASGIWFALQRLCTSPESEVAAAVVALGFEWRGFVASDWARVR
jgi:hypothetical protein